MHRALSALNMSRTLGGSEKFTLSFTVEVAAALIPFCPLFPFGIRPKLTPEKWGRETDGRMNKNKLSYPPSHGREGRIRGGNFARRRWARVPACCFPISEANFMGKGRIGGLT